MGEVQDDPPTASPPPQPPSDQPTQRPSDHPPQPPSAPNDHPPPPVSTAPPPPHPPRFDPSRTIGIIKRKALIKDLAALYHAECLTYCQELLELQRNCEVPYIDIKVPDESRKETMRRPERLKKSR